MPRKDHDNTTFTCQSQNAADRTPQNAKLRVEVSGGRREQEAAERAEIQRKLGHRPPHWKPGWRYIRCFGGAFLRISFAGPFSSEGKQINSGAGQKRAVTSWGIINVASPPSPRKRNRQSRHWRVGSRAVCRPTPAFSRGQWQLCGFRLVNREGRGTGKREGSGGFGKGWIVASPAFGEDASFVNDSRWRGRDSYLSRARKRDKSRTSTFPAISFNYRLRDIILILIVEKLARPKITWNLPVWVFLESRCSWKFEHRIAWHFFTVSALPSLYSKPFFRTCRVSGPLRAKSVSEDPVGVGQEWAHRGGQRAPL